MRSFKALLGVIVAGLVLSAPASGSGVPHKDYACYGEGNIYISTLEIKSDTKYAYVSDGGKYDFKSGPKVLHFESGPLKKWVGKLLKNGDGKFIKLTTDQSGGQTVNCYPPS